MKMNFKYTINLSVLLAAFVSMTVSAQKDTIPSLGSEFDFILPKVEIFIEAALEQNGMLNYRELDVEVLQADVKTKERIWLQNMGVRGDLRYGTFNNFVSNASGADITNIATLSQQTNYGIGLYLQLPIFDVLNRRNETKRAKMQVAQAESLIEEHKQVIQEKVLRLYEDLMLKYELLRINSTNYGNAKVNMEMVEKEFRNGQVEVYEYVRLNDIAARIQTEYEKAKSNFLLAKQLLENTSGLTIK